MITVPVPQSMYQQVVANMQSGEGIHVVGTPLQLTSNGATVQGVVAKLEQSATDSVQHRGLTITPVVSQSGGSQQVVQVELAHHWDNRRSIHKINTLESLSRSSPLQ